MISPAQQYYYAWDLSHKKALSDESRFTGVLSEAKVDLNPHQVEAALFAFKSPLSKGAILADEVGLGKTIEACILIAQSWAERKRHILIIVPASLRSQWNEELLDKFHIPSIVLEREQYLLMKNHVENLFDAEGKVIICSYNFAFKHRDELSQVMWDLVVIDEAHKLRNVYKKENQIAKKLLVALAPYKKVLLTATPLQNNLKELYGLISFIDGDYFTNANQFADRYNAITTRSAARYGELKARIQPIIHRTLRNQVQEYVNYTHRIAIIQNFTHSKEEAELYNSVNEYLQEFSYGIPEKVKPLLSLLIRKILASSAYALSFTLGGIINRLQYFEQTAKITKTNWLALLANDIDEGLEIEDEEELYEEEPVDYDKLHAEIKQLQHCHELALSISVESKANALIEALKVGFLKIRNFGAAEKALIFTESRHTQTYLKRFLQAAGIEVVTYNGTNNDDESKKIYENWLRNHKGSSIVTGNHLIDRKQAIIDYFRNNAQVMIATEAGAEGINLQFCALLINYDLPWNPQRVEQRIGRCHRYGQKYDVVVINFVNDSNIAEQRVYELLNSKFNLFEGVFGCSDEILGVLESGMDFEKRVNKIYQTCRTAESIQSAFDELQQELESVIQERVNNTKKQLIDNFDQDVIKNLKVRQTQDMKLIDIYEQRLWSLINAICGEFIAEKDDETYSLYIDKSPNEAEVPVGKYQITKSVDNCYQLRANASLGLYAVQKALEQGYSRYKIRFDLSGHPYRLSMLEPFREKKGALMAYRVYAVNDYDSREDIVFTVVDEDGNVLSSDIGHKMMDLKIIACALVDAEYVETEKHKELLAAEREKYNEHLQNDTSMYITGEMQKLDALKEEMLNTLEEKVITIRKELNEIKKRKRVAIVAREQVKLAELYVQCDKKLRRAQQELLDAQDEYDVRVEEKLEKLKCALDSKIHITPIFAIDWELV
jgi:ERCC4-related helicase